MAPTLQSTGREDASLLAGVEAQAHARAVLVPALTGAAAVSHAYLFHGPAGTGKRAVARAFAAALLAEGARTPETVAERVARDCHPDLTWVVPSGAAEMLVGDIEEPVVAASSRTPFESARRVFVIEQADAMNDQAANRMLKTLEEPPPFVHLLLLTDRREDVLPTIVSRCQLVRFDPLPVAVIAAGLEGVEELRAQACARLALGDAQLAALLAGDEGARLRTSAQEFARSALAGTMERRPWVGLLEVSRAAGVAAGEAVARRMEAELELVPAKERRRLQREGLEAGRRLERRTRTRMLELMLRLVELWLRDVMCMCEGAGEMVHAVDCREQLDQDAAGREEARVRSGISLVGDTRLSLALNVSEELALEALGYRLQELLAPEA